jgi:hypothetical protein
VCLLVQAAAKEPPAAPREPSKPVVYPNKEAAKEAFKQLLQVSTLAHVLYSTFYYCSIHYCSALSAIIEPVWCT